MRPVSLVVALVLAVASWAGAAETWIEVKSPNFTLVSNAGDGRARDMAWEFEQARAAFAKLWPWAKLAEGKVAVKRQTEYGYDLIEAPLPCIVAVSDAINEPRYPSLKGIMGAKKKPHETLNAADLGLGADEIGEAGSRTEVYALADPPSRGDSVRIEGDGAAAEKVVEYLTERKLI